MSFDIKDVACQILLEQFTVAPIYKKYDVLILVLLSINYIVTFTRTLSCGLQVMVLKIFKVKTIVLLHTKLCKVE